MVKRKNLIWSAVFAAVIAACLIFIFLTGGKSGENSAEIYENGKLIKTISDLSHVKKRTIGSAINGRERIVPNTKRNTAPIRNAI